MGMVEHYMAKEVLQQIVHSNRRVRTVRERWGGGMRDDGNMLLAHRLQKLKPKVENAEGSALRELRQNLGCNSIAEAEFVKILCRSQVLG